MRILALLLCLYNINCYIVPIIPKFRSLNNLYAADTAEKYDESLSRDLDSQEDNMSNNNDKNPSMKNTEKTSDIIDSFMTRFESFDGSISGDSHIDSIRIKGLDILQNTPTISGRTEAWRYTNLRKLLKPFINNNEDNNEEIQISSEMKTEISNYIDDSCVNSVLVFIDGKYNHDLSCTTAISSSNGEDGISFGPFTQMNEQLKNSLTGNSNSNSNSDSSLIKIIDRDCKPRDSFGSAELAAMNMAALEDGAIIKIDEDVTCPVPLQVLYYSSGNSNIIAAPRLFIEARRNSNVVIKQTFAGAGDSSDSNDNDNDHEEVLIVSNTHSIVERGGNIHHTYIQELGRNARFLEVLSADIAGDSAYDVSIAQLGSRVGKVNVHLHLQHTGANCSLNGTIMAHRQQSLDLHTDILHDDEATISRQQQRNVIGDQGEAIFKGRIRVPKHAQLTDSDQLCRSLMLGERARVIAMPTLEIIADDVSASHGASIADLDDNSLFYLASRGVNRKEARRLLLRGFVHEMLQGCVMDDKANERINRKLNSLNPRVDGEGQGSQKYTSI